MAQLYVGEHFWDKRTYEVTVYGAGHLVRAEWITEMTDWALENEIMLEWVGESTHTEGDNHWHQAHFCIRNPIHRTAFALRWK